MLLTTREQAFLVGGGIIAALLLTFRREVGDVIAEGFDMFATTKTTRENETRLLPVIRAAEQANKLPPKLLQRVLYQESRFRTDIITGETSSPAGAVGVAQIVPRWHPNVDPLDPVASIEYAAGYLSRLFDKFGSWSLALAAYNWGQGNVSKRKRPEQWPAETRSYVADIMDALRIPDTERPA